jgi:hypothetical protein
MCADSPANTSRRSTLGPATITSSAVTNTTNVGPYQRILCLMG